MELGFKLATEGFSPAEIVRLAKSAEDAGFDFVELSDHYHPWLESQGHSGFTWSMLGAIAERTERVGLVTGVTCPTMRYHPAIIAQAAATVALLSEGRFTLGVGSGERLNEHVTGQAWPSVTVRHAMLREALEIITLLWQGGYQSYDGRYLQIDDARVFDLPDALPTIAVAVSGAKSVELAAELGGGIFSVEPDPELLSGFESRGGSGPKYAEAPLAYAPTVDEAADAVMEKMRWFVTGWKVLSELPNPVNFDASAKTVRTEDIVANFACGPDVARHVEVVSEFRDAGFDHLVLMNAGPDPDAFLTFFAEELKPALLGTAH